MPLAKRTVRPLNLQKSTSCLAEASGDDFELFACLALVGAIRQLADLSTHAESIFEELASESKRVFERSESLCDRITSLECAVKTLNPKKVPRSQLEDSVRAPPVRLFGSIEADHFLRATCPDPVLQQYKEADITPVPLLRAFDNLRRDGLHGSQYFQCQPIIADERRRRQLELDQDDLKRPASICGGETAAAAAVNGGEMGLTPGMYFSQIELGRSNSRALTPAKPRPHSVACIVGSMDELDTKPGTDSIHLPTPEMVVQRNREQMPSSLIAIDTSGKTFHRMSALRQSAALRSAAPANNPRPVSPGGVSCNGGGGSNKTKQKSIREKRFRRQTISGLPDAVSEQLKDESQSSLSSSMMITSTTTKSGPPTIGRPQTLNLGRPSRMGVLGGVKKVRPSLSFDDDLSLAMEKTSPIDFSVRSTSYREPRSKSLLLPGGRQSNPPLFNSTVIDDSSDARTGEVNGFGATFGIGGKDLASPFEGRRGTAGRLSLRQRAANGGKSLFMSLRARSKSGEKNLEMEMPGKLKHVHRGRLPNLDDEDDDPLPSMELNMSTGRRRCIPITFGSNVMSTAVQLRNGLEKEEDDAMATTTMTTSTTNGSAALNGHPRLTTDTDVQSQSHQRDSQISEGSVFINDKDSLVSGLNDNVETLSQLSSIGKASVLSDSAASSSGPTSAVVDIRADGFSTTSCDRESSSTTRTVTPTDARGKGGADSSDNAAAPGAAASSSSDVLWAKIKNDSNASSKNSSTSNKQKTLVKRRSKVASSPDDDRSDSSKENTPVSSLLTHDNLLLHARGESKNNGSQEIHNGHNDNDVDTNASKRASQSGSVDLCVFEGVSNGASAASINRAIPRPKEDDETSVYSTDTDGFYTSMRADCGLKRRSYHGGAASPVTPEAPFSSDFYGGGVNSALKGASKEEPSIGTNGLATMPGVPAAASSSTPQSLRSSKRSVSTLSTASNMTEASVTTVILATTPPTPRKEQQRGNASIPRPTKRPPPPPPPARKTSALSASSSDDEATANIYADLQNIRDQIEKDGQKDIENDAAAAMMALEASSSDSQLLSYIDEMDEEDEERDADGRAKHRSDKSKTDKKSKKPSIDSSIVSGTDSDAEPVYSRIRSKSAAREYLSLCSVTPVPSDQSDSEHSYRMTTPDGNSFWATSPARPFNVSYDSNGSVPSTPKAENSHSNSFMSELQDVTKALEKFTFKSPLNEAKHHASSESPDRKTLKSNEVVDGRKFDSWPRKGANQRSPASSKSVDDLSSEDVAEGSAVLAGNPPDLLPEAHSQRRRVSSAVDSHYARPKSLVSPRSPHPQSSSAAARGGSDNNSSNDDVFFSGSSSHMITPTDIANRVPVIPEPAHAVLVSSSVRTYEPKTNFCHPVLHPPQHAVLPTSASSASINMYSDSPAEEHSATDATTSSTVEEDTSTSTTASAASSATTPAFAMNDTLSPLVNTAPSTFHTFGADDDDDRASSHDAEEAAPSPSSSSASTTYPIPFNKVALPANANKLSAIAALNGRSTNPFGGALSDSGYTSSTGSFDVMSKSSTSAASSVDDGQPQTSPNDGSAPPSTVAKETPAMTAKEPQSSVLDATILIRPNKPDGKNAFGRERSPAVGSAGDYSSFGSLERKRVAKVIVNADGTISPGNTLERRGSGKKSGNSDGTISPGNTLERRGNEKMFINADEAISPGNTLERRGSGKSINSAVIVSPGNTLERRGSGRKSIDVDGTISPGNTLERRGSGGISGSPSIEAGGTMSDNAAFIDAALYSNTPESLVSSIKKLSNGDNTILVTATGSLERKKKAVGARVNLMHMPNDSGNGIGSGGIYGDMVSKKTGYEPCGLSTTATADPHQPVASENPPIIKSCGLPRNYLSCKEKSPEPPPSSKVPNKAPPPPLNLLSPLHKDVQFIDDDETTGEASKPLSEVIVASAQLVPDDRVVSVNPTIPSGKAAPSAAAMEPVVQRVIMPDVVPLQEQEQDARIIVRDEANVNLGQRDVETDSPEPHVAPPLPMNEIDVSCYQPLSPKLDLRIQQKFDELLEKQIQQQLDQQKFDELLERQISQQMAKQQQLQQQQQNSQQQQNHYAAPKIHQPPVQLRPQSSSLSSYHSNSPTQQPPVTQQPPQQQLQPLYPLKPPSKPPRKFNLDTLSRVVEEDEEELEALIREEIVRKNRESGFAEPPSIEEGESSREEDDDELTKSRDDDDYDEVYDEVNDQRDDDDVSKISTSERMVTATSSDGDDVMIQSEILMTSTPDAVGISSLDAIFTSALDNTDDVIGEERGDLSSETEDEADSGVSREEVSKDEEMEEEEEKKKREETVREETEVSPSVFTRSEPEGEEQPPPTHPSRSPRNRPTSLTLKIDPQADSDDVFNGNVVNGKGGDVNLSSNIAAAAPSATPSSSVPSKSVNELFAKIHESKKKMNVRSDYDVIDNSDSRSSVSSASNSRSSSPVLSVAGSVESGVLSPRCLTPTASMGDLKGKGLASDRRGKKPSTSLHDFKMMLVQKTPSTVGSTKKISAVEMLKAGKSTPPSTPPSTPTLPTTPLSSPFSTSGGSAPAKRFPFHNLSSNVNAAASSPGSDAEVDAFDSPTPAGSTGSLSRSNPGSPRRTNSSLKTGKTAYDPAVLGALRSRRLVNEMAPLTSLTGSQSARSRLLRPDASLNRSSPGRQILETLDEGQSE